MCTKGVTPEAQNIIDRLEFKKRHTKDCQGKNGLTEWQPLADARKRCGCPYWSCGVHDRSEGFKRKATGEASLERAKAVVVLRLETGNASARLEGGKPISEAITDFMEFTRDGGAGDTTINKYQTLMDQLQAFADWKGYRYLQELTQDAILEFRRAWENPDAGYKQGRTTKDGRPLWRTQSITSSTSRELPSSRDGRRRRC